MMGDDALVGGPPETAGSFDDAFARPPPPAGGGDPTSPAPSFPAADQVPTIAAMPPLPPPPPPPSQDDADKKEGGGGHNFVKLFGSVAGQTASATRGLGRSLTNFMKEAGPHAYASSGDKKDTSAAITAAWCTVTDDDGGGTGESPKAASEAASGRGAAGAAAKSGGGGGGGVGGLGGLHVHIPHVPLPSAATTAASAASSAATAAASSIAGAIGGLTVRKYTLPDKTVASQVLMYRQLLHTSCRPGLRLSRAYQATAAQKAVMHMPWWEQGIEQTKRMVISYDNLIVRLWLNGAIMPYAEGGFAHGTDHGAAKKTDNEDHVGNISTAEPVDLLSGAAPQAGPAEGGESPQSDAASSESHVDTLIDDRGLPPIPHQYWVNRLGFQQPDPVTDFRSGGVLSLAMLVHIVESCPSTHARFLPGGDASVLPFGITCINVTDMLAKFLMFSKSVDRIDALLSQKPFWRMFADPSSVLVMEELSLETLADVVVEMGRERKIPGGKHEKLSNLHGERDGKVTVFDFAEILGRTEKRVNNDLLGAGPKSVQELRAVHARNRQRYAKALERKERDGARYLAKQQGSKSAAASAEAGAGGGREPLSQSPLNAADVPRPKVNGAELLSQPPDLLGGSPAEEGIEAMGVGANGEFMIGDEDDLL